MTLGQRIQAGRITLELSQEALGEKLGVSRQAVSKWEADGAVPDTDKLIALSKLFGMTLNELLQVDGPAAAEEGKSGADGIQEPVTEKVLSKQKLAALGVILLWIILLGNSHARIAELERRVTRLENRAAGIEAEYNIENLVRRCDFDFDFDQDLIYIDLTLSRNAPIQEVSFGVRGSTKSPVQGERQASGNYTAAVHVGGVESPFVLSAAVFDGTNEWDLPLARVEDYSAKEKGCRWASLWY